MKPDLILQSDLLDILFENRNKEYGAYAIRKNYSRDLFKSISIVMLASGILVLLFFSSKESRTRLNSILPGVPETYLSDVVLPPKEIPQVKVKPVKSIANLPPKIVPDPQANDKMPEINELAKNNISDVTVDGPEPTTENVTPPPNDQGSEKGAEVVQPKAHEEIIVLNPDKEAEFPGGVSAWMRFLQKNLRVPEDEAESKMIRVVVKFVVNEDGSLSDLEIINSGGSVFDNEVLRVMKKSPKWLAGSNQGRKVKVYHSQPVIFKYEAEQ